MIGAWRRALRGHPGWTGLAAGIAVGVALTLLATELLQARAGATAWEAGELVILSGSDESTDGQREQLIAKWNALGGGRPPARIEVVGGDTNQQRAEMVARAQGNASPVDVYNLDVILMEEFRKFGYIKELDESRVPDIDGFLANPMRTCRDDDGKLWALPFNTDAALLFYRTDLAGPAVAPNSLPALGSAIRDVFARPESLPTQLQAGYAGQLATYEGLTVNALEAIWAAGGQVVDDGGNVVIDSPQARNGLKWLADGLRVGNPQVIDPGSQEYREEESFSAFADGRVAFMRNWPVWHNRLAELRDAAGGPKVAFDVALLPGRGVLGGQNLAIAANSDQPRAAQELINFLTGELSQQILFERGGFAATRAIVYQDAAVRAKFPYTDRLLAAVNAADLRPRTAYYARFSEVFADGIRQALANNGELPAGFTERLTDSLQGVAR